jgi:hypothetical protein
VETEVERYFNLALDANGKNAELQAERYMMMALDAHFEDAEPA